MLRLLFQVKAHSSQTDGKKGFGGAFGVEKGKQDKAAHGFSEASDRHGFDFP